MELLAPIKNMENAKIAIKNGADALYLASPNFGARVNASLDLLEIKDIINLAKGYGVKTFITFNIVVFDNEISNFFKELSSIYEYGADGIILQDFSFIKIIKLFYPELEIHASTQMNIHNVYGVELVKKLGVNQVVVPREMNFYRIKKIKYKTNIKIESFVHGALCVCYSGQCYDSTLLDQKSANRGRCSQYCRMPLDVYNTRNNKKVSSGDYPLNLKDLNNLNILDEYEDSGVDVLKVEGRLKGIDYVGLTTSAYRDKLDYKDIDYNSLSKVYNRTFTNGRIAGVNGKDLVNLDRPNNTGEEVGKVLGFSRNNNKSLGYYKYKIELYLQGDVYKGDNLRFVDDNDEFGQEVEQFENNNGNIILYSNLDLRKGMQVFKTKNNQIIENYKKEILDINSKRKKIVVNIKLKNDLVLYSIFNEAEQKYYDFASDIEIFDSINKPLTIEQVLDVLKKTKNTDYDIVINDYEIEDGLFLPNKSLKVLRDEILENNSYISSESRELKLKEHLKSNSQKTDVNSNDNLDVQKEFYFTLRTIEQVKYFNDFEYFNKKYKIKLIFSHLLVDDLIESDSEYLIYDIQKKYDTYLLLPRINYDDEEDNILNIISYFNNLCISEIGSLKYKDLVSGEVISSFTFNTTNRINKNMLSDLGVDKQMLSIELNFDKIKNFPTSGSMINIYGSIPVMIMDYCPINLDKKNSCGDCTRCRKNGYSIIDKFGREFPLVYEGNNKIGLYTKKVLGLFDELNELSGFNYFYLNLLNEGEKELEYIFDSIDKRKTLVQESFKGNYYKEVL